MDKKFNAAFAVREDMKSHTAGGTMSFGTGVRWSNYWCWEQVCEEAEEAEHYKNEFDGGIRARS